MEDNQEVSLDDEKAFPSEASITEGSHSKTEGSHSKADAEAAAATLEKDAVATTSTTRRSSRPLLLGVGILTVLCLAVVLPLALKFGGKKDSDKSHTEGSNSVVSSATNAVVYDTFEYTPEDNDQCPGHVFGEDGVYGEVSDIWALELSLGERGKADERTFAVEPSHEPWKEGPGVVFNVETVTEALPEDLAKPILEKGDVRRQVQLEARQFYQNATAAETMIPPPPLPNVTLEVVSKDDDLPMVYAGSQGFLAAAMMSFAQHLPLALTADHLWTIIVQGFARHVDQHSEELRYNFVAHQGKVEIVVREDRMVRGETPPDKWEEWIFPKFSKAIGENMVNQEAHETLAGKHFTTATPTSHAAAEIALMASFKSYFEYTMVTACGIPKIRLEGTREDWVALRDNTAKLAKWMMPGHSHGELWIKDIVLPILDEFVKAYDGHINYCFWQTMVKFRTTGVGSGTYEFLSGWLPTLFPYLTQGPGGFKPNPFLRGWEESASALLEGPEPSHIPSQLSSVPVNWEYFEVLLPLHFHAGFRGVTQEADGTLSPVMGWYVTNDPVDESN